MAKKQIEIGSTRKPGLEFKDYLKKLIAHKLGHITNISRIFGNPAEREDIEKKWLTGEKTPTLEQMKTLFETHFDHGSSNSSLDIVQKSMIVLAIRNTEEYGLDQKGFDDYCAQHFPKLTGKGQFTDDVKKFLKEFPREKKTFVEKTRNDYNSYFNDAGKNNFRGGRS